MLTPTSEAELAETLAAAASPLHIQGGGTRPIGRLIDAEPLSTSALSGITLYEPGALTLVVQAGTPMAEIEAALDAENQMLAFEPMDHRTLLGTNGTPTIGGVVATNNSGPRRVSTAGACRDSLLGVRFVDGSGTILKNGGRVMKNVTGYDLVKLMAGSYGTLGVLSEVSLKVLPRPDDTATISLGGLDPAQAIAAMSAAVTTPYEVTGAAYVEDTVHIRVEGMESSVSYRAQQLAKALTAFGSPEITQGRDANRPLWTGIRDMTYLADQPFVARSSVKPSAAAQILADLADTHTTSHLDWAGGLIWTGTDQLGDDNGASLLARLQDHAAKAGGHTTLIKGPDALRRGLSGFQPQNPVVERLGKGLRAKFDPKSILNPGVMG